MKKKPQEEGAMQDLLTGKKRLVVFDAEWIEIKLGERFDCIIGGGTPSRTVPTFWNGKLPCVTVKDFATFKRASTQEYITDSGLVNSATHLIPKRTPIIATRIGLGQIVVYDIDVTINQDLKALILNKHTDTNFFVYWYQNNKSKFEFTQIRT